MSAEVRSREKEALEWALDYFRDTGAELTKIASRNIGKDYMEDKLVEWCDRQLREDPKNFDSKMASHIHLAMKGDGFEISDICRLAARLIEEDKFGSLPRSLRKLDLPKSLRNFVGDFLRNPSMKSPRKRGPNSDDYQHRNFFIAGAILEIRDTWGLPATRNNREKIPIGRNRALVSAASIVRVALAKSANLNLSEAAVNKIWDQWCGMIGVSQRRKN